MNDMAQGNRLTTGKRIIIKIGSKMLVDPERGTLHRQWLDAHQWFALNLVRLA